jgi:uncharacterized protein (TIGR02145 family)
MTKEETIMSTSIVWLILMLMSMDATMSHDYLPESDRNALCFADSETVRDSDGNVYRAVRIGNQIWMAENLKTTKFCDGQAIPYVSDDNAWGDLRTPGYCWPNNDSSNKDAYGALYNWYTVESGKLAPAGWHVPTDEEWKTLSDYLGGVNIAGGKLKETGTEHWVNPNKGATNETGFGARGAGVRNSDGAFALFGEVVKYWTSTRGGWHSETDAQYWCVNTFEPSLGRSSHQRMDGHSVRCIKDEK